MNGNALPVTTILLTQITHGTSTNPERNNKATGKEPYKSRHKGKLGYERVKLALQFDPNKCTRFDLLASFLFLG